jgi:hypothetical protein
MIRPNNDARMAAEERYERRNRVEEYLRETKTDCHPFDGILQALGFDKSQHLEPYPSGSIKSPKVTSEPLRNYPFPAAATALAWSCFDNLDDYEHEDLDGLFDAFQEEIWEGLDGWRAKGEKELVTWRRSEAHSPHGNAEVGEDVTVVVLHLLLIIRLR